MNEANWEQIIWSEKEHGLDRDYTEQLKPCLPAQFRGRNQDKQIMAMFVGRYLSLNDQLIKANADKAATSKETKLQLEKQLAAATIANKARLDQQMATLLPKDSATAFGFGLNGGALIFFCMVLGLLISLAVDTEYAEATATLPCLIFIFGLLTFVLGRRQLRRQQQRQAYFQETEMLWSQSSWVDWHNVVLAQYFNRLSNWLFGKRPAMAAFEGALADAVSQSADTYQVWSEPLEQLEAHKSDSKPPSFYIDNLNHDHWLERFLARHMLFFIGGAATSHLQVLVQNKNNLVLRQTALWILHNISWETTARLADQQDTLLCSHCITACTRHQIAVSSFLAITYYGCRACHNSRDLIPRPKQIVALLDREQAVTQFSEPGTLLINWLDQETIFDFDAVRINQADDKDVERFVLQQKNNVHQRARLKRIVCTISPNCTLSQNSLRLLKDSFNQVENPST
ncbi:MAG: hypothetical protein AAF629_04275 [Chloroflexota bacterium]